jgi:hypothetical protein
MFTYITSYENDSRHRLRNHADRLYRNNMETAFVLIYDQIFILRKTFSMIHLKKNFYQLNHKFCQQLNQEQ